MLVKDSRAHFLTRVVFDGFIIKRRTMMVNMRTMIVNNMTMMVNMSIMIVKSMTMMVN